jgi:hypothetical protein
MESLNLKARIYLTLIVLCGCGMIIYAFVFHRFSMNMQIFAFSVMAALIGPASVRIGTKVEMSPVFPFSFSALLLYGISGAIFVGIVNMLASCLLRKKTLSMPKILFNLFSVSIALFVAGMTFTLICSSDYSLSNQTFLSAVLMATLVFYLVNTFLVTGIVAVTETRTFFLLWREKFIWTAPSYYAGSSFAVAFAFLVDRFGVWVIVLALPPCALIYYFYRFYVNSSEEKQKLLLTIKQLEESGKR